MSDIDLTFLPPGHIAIPEDICAHHLTLAEIGALVVVQCMVAGAPAAGPEVQAEFMGVLPSLRDRGIIAAEQSGSTLKLVIDLEAA